MSSALKGRRDDGFQNLQGRRLPLNGFLDGGHIKIVDTLIINFVQGIFLEQ